MARRKLEDKNIRKLTKIGKKSIAVILPIEMIRELKWCERQKVIVKKSGKKLVMSGKFMGWMLVSLHC